MSSPLPIPTTKQAQRPRPLGSSPAPTSAPPPFMPRTKRKMSIAQTYFLAHRARAKLSSEAARPDHNLRLLVGHANLLDSLMLELADAEREQQSWFNQTVRRAASSHGGGGSSSSNSSERHIQWADTIVEPDHGWRAEDAESDDSSDSDSDSDCDLEDGDDEDVEMADAVPLRRLPSRAVLAGGAPHKPLSSDVGGGGNKDGYDKMEEEEEEDDDDDDDYDMEDEEDYAQLTLRRSPSHSSSSSAPSSPTSPPELDEDSDDLTEDEPMPPSPPTTLLPEFEDGPQKLRNHTTAVTRPTDPGPKDAFYEEGYYLPPRNPARLISEISVY